jgi:hypothetical protein
MAEVIEKLRVGALSAVQEDGFVLLKGNVDAGNVPEARGLHGACA